MDVGQIREERKMVISLWGPGSQAVSPTAGPQLAENSAQYKKKYTIDLNKRNATEQIYGLISREFTKQRPKSQLPIENFLEDELLESPLPIVELLAEAFFLAIYCYRLPAADLFFPRSRNFLMGAGKLCPLGLYYICIFPAAAPTH